MDGAPAILALTEIDSTNAEARRRLDSGGPAPFWSMAERQTAGRGRRGRSWHSDAGNLFLSGGFRLDRPVGDVAQLSFAAALAVAGCLDTALDPAVVRFKWPNDVLVSGRKCAGVLLESSPWKSGVALVVGVGVNLVSAPDDTTLPATSVVANGARCAVDAIRAAEHVITEFEAWRAIWARDGFAPLRQAWLARASGLGEPVQARLGSETVTGTFSDLDEEGALVLATHAGVRRVRAGEVIFPAMDKAT